MTVISGKDAYINGVGCLASWSAAEAVDQQLYAASCTGGGQGVSDGNINWSGSAAGKGHTPGLLPTDAKQAFKGISDNSAGDMIAYDGSIVVAQTTIDMPIASGGPITWASSFLFDGLLVEGTVGAADTTVAEAPSAKGVSLKIAATAAALAAATALSDIQSISLVLSRAATDYVSGGATFRTVGNLTASLSFEVLDRSIAAAIYAANVFNVAEITVESGKTWELPIKWGSKSNFTVDAESRKPVGFTVAGTWSAVVPDSLSLSNIGWIKAPDTTYFFGVAPT